MGDRFHAYVECESQVYLNGQHEHGRYRVFSVIPGLAMKLQIQ